MPHTHTHTQFYQGCAAEEQSRQGELIAWLQLSLQKLTAIGKIPKSLGDLREAAKKFFDHVNDRLQVVKRQNDQVYHAPIPEPDTLEQTTGNHIPVQPIPIHCELCVYVLTVLHIAFLPMSSILFPFLPLSF